jgi:hypothetical protein
MFRKLLLAGAIALLALAPSLAPVRAQQFAPVPTSPTTAPPAPVATAPTTSTTEPATTVDRTAGDFADTGPRDWIGWITMAGVVAIALGVTLRGKRAPGAFYFDR